MKNYNSTEEGQWKEISDIKLTKEQKDLLFSADTEENKEAKVALMAELEEARNLPVSETKAAELTALYNAEKAKIENSNSETYMFGGCGIYEFEGPEEGSVITTGTIRCIINGRFVSHEIK